MPNALILRSLASATLGALLCSTALAQTIDTAVTTTNGGNTIDGGDTLTVSPNGSVTISGTANVRAIDATGDDNTITNQGTITVTTSGNIAPSGVWTVDDPYSNDLSYAIGIFSDGTGSTVANDGEISIENTSTGSNGGFNRGIVVTGADGSMVSNAGDINVEASADYSGHNMGILVGVDAEANPRGVSISNSGRIGIESSGDGSGNNRGIQIQAVEKYYSDPDVSIYANVINEGFITITADGGGNRGIENRVVGSARLVNLGEISITSGGGGNRGLQNSYYRGAASVYLRNAGDISISIVDDSGGGNRGMQSYSLGGGYLRALNEGSITIVSPSSGNRGIMATGGADNGYILNAGEISVSGTGGLRGVMARGVNGTVVNTGSITVTGAGSTRGIESNVNWGRDAEYNNRPPVEGEGNTTIINRGSVVVRFADDFDLSGFEDEYGSPTLSALEVGDSYYGTTTSDVLIITNSGVASAWGGNAIQVDNYYGASAVINLEAGSILIGDVSIDNPDVATINFGSGLTAIVRTNDGSDGSGIPATINVEDGEYAVVGDTIYVLSDTAGSGGASSPVPTIAAVSSLSLDALSQRDTLRGPGVQVARGGTQTGPLGWGTLFARSSNGPDASDDVTTRGLMLGAPLASDIGLFFGMAKTRAGSVERDHMFGGVYAGFEVSGLDAELSLTFGRADGGADMVIADNTIESGLRTLSLGGDSSYIMPALTLSGDLPVGQATLTPSLRMSYARIQTESGGFDLGPLSQPAGTTQTDVFALRGQLAHSLDEADVGTGLLSTDLRVGFDAAYVSAEDGTSDWEDGRMFIGADVVYAASDTGLELTGGIELGRTSGGVNDLRAAAGFSLRF